MSGTDKEAEVESFMQRLEHPFKADIDQLRKAIKGISPAIHEEIKWNAPSFKTDDHFATFKLYPPKTIQIVLHTGAKAKKPPRQFHLKDPHSLLTWAAPDRCVLTLTSSKQSVELQGVVVNMVKEWLGQL
jgi:hypothetical protein